VSGPDSTPALLSLLYNSEARILDHFFPTHHLQSVPGVPRELIHLADSERSQGKRPSKGLELFRRVVIRLQGVKGRKILPWISTSRIADQLLYAQVRADEQRLAGLQAGQIGVQCSLFSKSKRKSRGISRETSPGSIPSTSRAHASEGIRGRAGKDTD
jgi:hypothetical protein